MTHFTADILYLFPPSSQIKKTSSSNHIAPIQHLAKTIAWPLLSDEKAFQVLSPFQHYCFFASFIVAHIVLLLSFSRSLLLSCLVL
jgi:hypothetical protein